MPQEQGAEPQQYVDRTGPAPDPHPTSSSATVPPAVGTAGVPPSQGLHPQAFRASPEIMAAIFNACLRNGCFPRIWKTAKVITLRKPNKDQYSHPKSYRPIGLLPILGKIHEKILCRRLLWEFGKEGLNPRQYGFMPQRSTEDALYDAIEMVREHADQGKIVALISLDIEGAFDNAWWPQIKYQLAKRNINKNLTRTFFDYLSERKIILTYAGQTIEKVTEKGCVQGSVGGPLMWDLIMDPLLDTADNLEAHIQAFADDLFVIATGANASEVQEKANKALKAIENWGLDNKLRLAPHKTQAIVITKKLKYQKPDIEICGTPVTYSNSLKLLGLTIDSKLNFQEHLDNTNKKVVNIYRKLSSSCRATWGLKSEIAKILYIAVIEPTILCAASVWEPVLRRKNIRKRVDRMNRMFTILISKAHKTTSLMDSTVLSRTIPLHLRIVENAELYRIKRGKPMLFYPDRPLERRAHPFDLPHPSKRKDFALEWITQEQDLENLNKSIPTIYTDGSKLEGKVGAAVSCWDKSRETKSAKIKLSDYCSVYQAEMVALHKATNIAQQMKIKQLNIASDSRSALQTIADPNNLNPIAVAIRNRIREDGTTIHWYWIKAHVGLEGNERADHLPKEATKAKTAPAYSAVPLSSVKYQIRQKTIEEYQRSYETERADKPIFKFFSDVRRSHKILSEVERDNLTAQIITGHGGFGEYLKRFKIKDDDRCNCDNTTPQTALHCICDCPKFGTLRWETEQAIETDINIGNIKEIMDNKKKRAIFMEMARKIARDVTMGNK